MPSELWQRIRSARKYADLNQGDVAQVCGVGRPAVTLWESKDAARAAATGSVVGALATGGAIAAIAGPVPLTRQNIFKKGLASKGKLD